MAIAGYQVLTNWAIRELNFKLLGRARIWLYACTGVAQLALGWLSLGAAGLVVGHVAGYVVAVAILSAPVLIARQRLSSPSPRESVVLLRRYRGFLTFGATSSFLNSAGVQIPVLGMAILYGAEIAGWYGLAQRAFGIPLSVVALALGQSLKANMAEAVRKGELAVAIQRLLKLAVMVQLGLSMLLLVVVFVAPQLFSLVFGESWRISGVYLQVLAPLFLAQFVVAPLHVVFDVLEQPHFHFTREALRIALLGCAFLFANFWTLDPMSTVMLISGSGFLVYLFSGLLVAVASRRAIAQSLQRADSQ
jgi:O-antigen/teichoic acid export membrane protein